MQQKHQTRVGPEYQVEVPQNKYFVGSRPTLGRCVTKAGIDGMTRADTAEQAGILMFQCDKLPEDKLDYYMKTAESMTPPMVKFDKTEALQILHNNNYNIEQALLNIKINMEEQNRYNQDFYNSTYNFAHFE